MFTLAAVIAAIALVAAMAWSQDDVIFPVHAVAPPDPLPKSAGRLTVDGSGGAKLHGVHIPPNARSAGSRALVLAFGGNAWNADNVASYLHELFPQPHVVVFHYRGYSPSTGRPSADALIADAPLVFDAAVDRVKPRQVVAVGFSIGSGVAASLAKRRDLDGLILVTPFDSLKAVAQQLYPWLPVGPFFQHEFDTVGFLSGADVPVAIVAAERDEIIPTRRTDALRAKAVNLVFDRTIPRAGHNDIYFRPDFHKAMGDAFEAVSRKPK